MGLYAIMLLLKCGFWLNSALAEGKVSIDLDGGRELIYLQILTTNGLFTPLELYPKDENLESDWEDGLGELTKLGKIQHYELGKLIRDYYRDFITTAPTEIDAFSSAEDRSTHSLLCFLASFYAPTKDWEFLPGFHWQPIPVSYLDRNDTFFRYPENCVAQVLEKNKAYTASPFKDILLQDKFYYSYWTNHSGAQLKNWIDVAKLFDTLDKERRFGLKVPQWAQNYWYDLKRITDAAYGWNYQSVLSLQLKVGTLIQFMTLRMLTKIYEPDAIKVSVYMTHDWNMAAFLTALRRFNGLRPPPCATITIEMYKNRIDGQYSVRMYFFNSSTPELKDQKPHLLTLNKCPEFCPLGSFVNYFQDIIPQDFDKTCKGFSNLKGI